MQIRAIEPRDVPRLKELQGEYEWKFGPDFMQGLVVVDANDCPVIFAGAWKRAEAHVVCDTSWATPGERMAAFSELHFAMDAGLVAQDVGQAVTWFDGNEKSFLRRLARLGWKKSLRECWTRRLG